MLDPDDVMTWPKLGDTEHPDDEHATSCWWTAAAPCAAFSEPNQLGQLAGCTRIADHDGPHIAHTPGADVLRAMKVLRPHGLTYPVTELFVVKVWPR